MGKMLVVSDLVNLMHSATKENVLGVGGNFPCLI
jgi:hypothetical protein